MSSEMPPQEQELWDDARAHPYRHIWEGRERVPRGMSECFTKAKGELGWMWREFKDASHHAWEAAKYIGFALFIPPFWLFVLATAPRAVRRVRSQEEERYRKRNRRRTRVVEHVFREEE